MGSYIWAESFLVFYMYRCFACMYDCVSLACLVILKARKVSDSLQPDLSSKHPATAQEDSQWPGLCRKDHATSEAGLQKGLQLHLVTSLHLTVCSQELKRTRSPPPKKDTVGMRGKKGFKSSKLLGQQSSFLKSELYWGGVERKPLAKNLNTATNFKVWSSPGSWEGRAGGGGVGMTQGLRVSLTVPADPECATRLGWPQSPASSSLLLLHSGIKDMCATTAASASVLFWERLSV